MLILCQSLYLQRKSLETSLGKTQNTKEIAIDLLNSRQGTGTSCQPKFKITEQGHVCEKSRNVGQRWMLQQFESFEIVAEDIISDYTFFLPIMKYTVVLPVALENSTQNVTKFAMKPKTSKTLITIDMWFYIFEVADLLIWLEWLSVMVFEPLMLAGTFSQNFSQRKKYHWYHAFEVMFLGYLNLLFKILSFWLGVLSEMLKFLDDKRFWWRKNINSYGKIGMLNYYIVVVLKVTSDNTSVFKVAECYFKICYSKPSYQNWLPNYCAKPDDKCDCSDRCSRYS